ncbi:hypothetical protein, partial [Lentisphaera araneosa]
MMKKLLFVILIAPFLCQGLVENSPYSWKQKTRDGKHIFIMNALDPKQLERERKNVGNSLIYNKSGLYNIEDTSNPIWTIDWYTFMVYMSLDGSSIVRFNNHKKGDITFYKNGQEVNYYQKSDLINFMKIMEINNSLTYYESIDVNDENNILILETAHKEKYVFDLDTGKIIDSSNLHGIISLIV